MAFSVLVVDDNRLMRNMVARAVCLSGLAISAVLEAGDGAQALAALRSQWVDLVLLDINMPVMDGEEFLRQLRADTALSATLVVVVSTESSQPRIARLKAMGAGFIHKPFRPEALVAAVNELMASKAGAMP
ncbi:response regulator [Planctomycetota bacterium]|nr:response regulator [Planctomycetota bacterium]